MTKILSIVGARPNFVKIAPIIDAMTAAASIEPYLVHSGQHYDYKMSQAFFEDLGIREADINLGVNGGSHAKQTAETMISFEKVCQAEKPDLVLVVGDVNPTIACALTAKKFGIPVAHVEAGLRSGDMRMPEEVNRRCTDAITDYFFTTEPSAEENLLREGVDKEQIYFVGNVMIDTLFKHRKKAAALGMASRLGVSSGEYAVITLHRPSNTSKKQVLSQLLEAIGEISTHITTIFPMHPRTRNAISEFNLESLIERPQIANSLQVIEPLRYLEFIGLMQGARMVLTDSGGLQEETTALSIPCLTMRENTERPITCSEGTNKLIGVDPHQLLSSVKNLLASQKPEPVQIKNWDGHAAQRIVEQIQKIFA